MCAVSFFCFTDEYKWRQRRQRMNGAENVEQRKCIKSYLVWSANERNSMWASLMPNRKIGSCYVCQYEYRTLRHILLRPRINDIYLDAHVNHGHIRCATLEQDWWVFFKAECGCNEIPVICNSVHKIKLIKWKNAKRTMQQQQQEQLQRTDIFLFARCLLASGCFWCLVACDLLSVCQQN